jgi:hypothetical protein
MGSNYMNKHISNFVKLNAKTIPPIKKEKEKTSQNDNEIKNPE